MLSHSTTASSLEAGLDNDTTPSSIEFAKHCTTCSATSPHLPCPPRRRSCRPLLASASTRFCHLLCVFGLFSFSASLTVPFISSLFSAMWFSALSCPPLVGICCSCCRHPQSILSTPFLSKPNVAVGHQVVFLVHQIYMFRLTDLLCLFHLLCFLRPHLSLVNVPF